MLQDALELLRVHQRQQVLAARVGLGRALADVVAVEQPVAVRVHHPMEARRGFQQALVHDLAGEQRDQADPREHVDALGAAVGTHHHVLEEAVLLVPQRNAHAAAAGDGVGDAEELHVALDRDVLVVRVGGRQLQAHQRHVQREHRHPAGGVRLLEAEARAAAAASGRTPRCCPAPGSRPRTRCCRRRPCGSATRCSSSAACASRAAGIRCRACRAGRARRGRS